MQSLLLANGIKTINAVNFYPDLKKWNLIDSKGKNILIFIIGIIIRK